MTSTKMRDGDFKVPNVAQTFRQTQINAHFVTNQRQKIDPALKGQLLSELKELNSKKALLLVQSRYDF